MIFSMDTVLDSKNKEIKTLLNDPEYDFDKNIFDETVAIINAENESFSELFLDTFDEGFFDKIKDIDFSTILSKIFELFASALGNLIHAFGAFLLNFVNDDTELKLFKNKLANFRGNIRYTKPYYTYTNIQANSLPSNEYKRDIDNVYFSFTDEFSNNFSKISEKNQLISAMRSKIEELSAGLNSDQICKIRGFLCGTNNIMFEDYHDELFKYFRNGEMNRVEDKVKLFEKNIDGNRIAVAYKDYYASKKQIGIVNREGYKYRVEAMAAKAKIRTFNPLQYIDKSLIGSDTMVEYNKLISANCKQIKFICDTYLMYFSAKVDAIKEYNKTNKEILLMACKEIAKESGKNY